MFEMYLSQSDIYSLQMDGSVKRYHHNYCLYKTENEAVEWINKLANEVEIKFANIMFNGKTVRCKNRLTGEVYVYYYDRVPVKD